VPRAADGFTDDQSFCERTAVMGAGRADGEHLLAAPRKQHGIVTHMSTDHAPIGYVI